eukprot:GHVR01036871.1.p2 GENE.GHVR01036871.1~~GHVR01036871.1.p2  ORF type:complete len:118 (-),score=13.78 GHVR01036871.1:1701-2054(-)
MIQLYGRSGTGLDFKLYDSLGGITSAPGTTVVEGVTASNKLSVNKTISVAKEYYLMVGDQGCNCPYTLTVYSGTSCTSSSQVLSSFGCVPCPDSKTAGTIEECECASGKVWTPRSIC